MEANIVQFIDCHVLAKLFNFSFQRQMKYSWEHKLLQHATNWLRIVCNMKRDIFQAIADPTRRAILVLLTTQAMTPNALAEQFDISRQAISKHIKILKECDVVEQQKAGREIYYHSKPDKMKEIDNWLERFRQHWDVRLDQLDKVLTNLKLKKDEN